MMNISAATSARTSAHVNAPASAEDVPLEPDHELPTAAPYRPSVGAWIGIGAAALGAGGVLGIGAAGAVKAAAEFSGFVDAAVEIANPHAVTAIGRRSGGVGVAFAGAAALVGGALGGFGVYAMNRHRFDQREQARIEGEHGTSTLEVARDMIHQFDHDSSGSIDLIDTSGIASHDERVSSDERRRRLPMSSEWVTETRSTSATHVWTAADVDSKDQIVTDVELARLMSQFDVDRNGALSTPEQDAFRAAHPVIADEWTR